ncbi:MAG TPA: EAL domain-containing protein, partial [Micromonosporaceae bacterium]
RAFRDGQQLTTRHGCYISVNDSVAQLRLTGFADRIRSQLSGSPISPERVVIEITESQLVGDDEKIWDDLAELRETGLRVAIDDYGTGYASLSYLRHPVIDIVKLDRRFVDNIATERSRSLLRAVLGLTRELGLPLIAEGIEDETTRAALVELGCDYGQGHLFAPAMPLEQALDYGR